MPGRTLVSLAAQWAAERPGDRAYVHLDDRAEVLATLTFAELDTRARNIAAALLDNASPGDRALMIYETGLDFVCAFFGTLLAGVVGVPIPTPEPGRLQRYLPRLRAVIDDAGAELILGNTRSIDALGELNLAEQSSHPLRPLDTTSRQDAPSPAKLPDIGPDTLAYLQYTSGSTSQPKGVMITHGDLMTNLEAMRQGLGYDATSRGVCWMPHFHDYGLIEGHLEPFFNGAPAHLLSPYDFVKRPLCWLEAITKHRLTHTQGPNFAYAHCLRRIPIDRRRGLDLSTLRSAGNAAEPINPVTLRRFTEEFGAHGFPKSAMATAYGLAEVTLMATATPPGEESIAQWFDAQELGRHRVVPAEPGSPGSRCVAGCGRPLPGIEVAIVDPDTLKRCPADGVGEVWLNTESVSSGYWRRPEESEGTFRARIAGDGDNTYLRTGDLGFMRDGELYIVSRLKDLIIVRGMNHHPQDIEWTVQEVDPSLRPGSGAAFAVEGEGDERLVIVQEIDGRDHAPERVRNLLERIAESVLDRHDLPVHAAALVERGSVLKTSSGKVQRRAMRDAFLNGTLQVVATWDRGNTALNAANTASASTTNSLLQWIRGYAESRINSRLIDERRGVPPSIILDFGNRGLFGLQVPQAYGGLELSHKEAYRVYRQLGAMDLTLATLVFLHNTNGIFPILWFGTEAQKRTYLPGLAGGRELGAFALSEPGAGSHLGGIATRAEPRGSGWSLYGEKRWNGSAWAGVTSVFARIPGERGRPGDLSAFVMRLSDPGVHLGPESLTMGIRGIMQNMLSFDGAPVSEDNLLGKPGDGMHIATSVLSASRLVTAAVALGAAQRCAQLMLRYAARRTIETGTLLENPQTKARMSRLHHRIALGLEILDLCAAERDAGRDLPGELAMAVKVGATDTLLFGADLLVQLLGGRGYMENNLAPQLFRDARMLSIGEGPNEALTAAMGRWARLQEPGPPNLLRDRFGNAQAADAFSALRGMILDDGGATPGGRDADSDRRIRRDVLLGRALIAALDLLGAQRMAARNAPGYGATLAWAEHRLEALRRDVADDETAPARELSAQELTDALGSYHHAIGDLEPGAPDVDTILDPLLRREDTRSLEAKRERLRKLLESKGKEQPHDEE